MSPQNKHNTQVSLIRAEIKALNQGHIFGWGRLSRLLDLVEKSEFWKNDSLSFTDWVSHNSTLLGAKSGSLWRYRSSGRFYTKLLEDFPSLAKKPLEELAKELSPENLELLSKISRVAPEQVFIKLAQQVLSGQIKRSELRDVWSAFRPVLEGKTARGRGVTPTNVIIDEIENQNDQHILALIKNYLSNDDSSWTQQKQISTYSMLFDITDTDLDAVAIVVCEKYVLKLHGIKIFSHNRVDFRRYTNNLESLAKKCDFLWVALPSLPKNFMPENIPNNVGVMVVDYNGIQITRSARSYPKSETNIEPLLRKVLLKAVTR